MLVTAGNCYSDNPGGLKDTFGSGSGDSKIVCIHICNVKQCSIYLGHIGE